MYYYWQKEKSGKWTVRRGYYAILHSTHDTEIEAIATVVRLNSDVDGAMRAVRNAEKPRQANIEEEQ